MLQTALRFLYEHKEIALATCEGNLPKLRLFQIMKQDGTHLYFATSPKKAVYRQLQENPNVEILATDNRISVRCEGMVSFEVDEATQRWIYEHNPVLPRLYTSYDKLAYFVLPIAEMDYYDLNPTPPVFKHFDLISGEVSNGFVGERFSK
jgi:uncharacterized pyridoxamine 5'-phosphate oxidase family protein